VWWGTTKRILLVLAALGVLPAAGARADQPPPGRAWELVSPSEKGGNDVIAETSRTHASAGAAPGLPAAVGFASLGGFADAIGGGIATEYLAQRTAQPGTSGWTTHAITPPQAPMSVTAAANQLDPAYEAFTPDLEKAVFRAWSPLTDAPNVTEVENLYARDDLRTPGAGTYRLLTNAPAPLAPIRLGSQRPFLAAATDDLAHVLLESRLALTPDAPGGNPTLFKADGGSLHMLAPAGGCPGAILSAQPCSVAGLGATGLHLTGDALSADGSRVVLTSPVTGSGNVSNGAQPSRLYQLDDRGTPALADDALVQLNASELAVPESPQAASFQAASADGTHVYFTSAERLTEDAAPGGGLYLWERQPDSTAQVTGRLTAVAPGGTIPRVLGASRDGRRVYFAAPGQLVPGGPHFEEEGVYLWQEDPGGGAGTTSFVGAISFGDVLPNSNTAALNLQTHTSRVTPDGSTLLLELTDTDGIGAGYDHGACAQNPNRTTTGRCAELYVYRADASTPLAPAVVCASCRPPGTTTGENALLSVHVGAGASQVTTHLSHALSDDGRRVFFSSAAPLVAADANGQVDAYEYDVPSGTLRLLSSGRDTAASYFLDASANGDDAYFLTREQLVGWDVDRAYDLYDARVGGGFPDPPMPPPACTGDACRGRGHAAPPFASLGSTTLLGPVRAAAGRTARQRAKACRRGFERRKLHGRRRCVKKRRHVQSRRHRAHHAPPAHRGIHGRRAR
jgi:hypothetical protein